MTIEDVKTYLALYDEAYSYQEIAIKTGYPVSQLRELYDEIFYAKEIGKRRRSMQRMNAMKGVYRVHPVTFEVTSSECRNFHSGDRREYPPCRELLQFFLYPWDNY